MDVFEIEKIIITEKLGTWARVTKMKRDKTYWGEWSTRYLVQYKGGALCRWARFHVCYEKGFLHEGDIIGENTVHIGWSEGSQVDNFQTSLFSFKLLSDNLHGNSTWKYGCVEFTCKLCDRIVLKKTLSANN